MQEQREGAGGRRRQSSWWHVHGKVKASAAGYALALIAVAAIDQLLFPLPVYAVAALPGALAVATGYSASAGAEDA